MPSARREAELRRVYREHVDAVYAFHAYRVSRRGAEDLTQLTFERVVRHWKRYDPRIASERTWILSIARNVGIDHFRRESHRATASTDEHPALLDTLDHVDDPLATTVSRDTITTWLEALSPREIEIIALRFGAELSAKEVAEMLELSDANVHQIASRALKKMRARVQDPDSVARG